MSPPRVLVADDNPLSLRFLAEALAACGLGCVDASDGAAALERARESAFDLLLFDARMPGLGGAETLARVRAQPGPSRQAIALATTADTERTAHAALLDAGFADVLVKPLGVQTLRDALARHLSIPSAPIDTSADASLLDDSEALRAAGGDITVVDALRLLFAQELDALPAELDAICARADRAALYERLHRLDASAGFCGAPGLARAASRLRSRLDAPSWPSDAVVDFLAVGARVRAMLAY